MIHATIAHHSATLCTVSFIYDKDAKEAVKALAGASYDDGVWIIPIMHLPTLKAIFAAMDVAPEVVANYHRLLKQMMCDTATSVGVKGEVGRHLAELYARHANGIAHVLATGWQPTSSVPAAVPVAPKPEPTPAMRDDALELWLKGSRNAMKATERKATMIARRHRQR